MIRQIIKNIKASNTATKFIRNASWSLIGSVSGKALMLVSFIFVARIIGSEEYGKVGIIRSTINMFITFSSTGLGLTASRYIAYYRNTDEIKVYQIYKASIITALIFGIIISVFVFAFSYYISITSFKTVELSLPLKLSIIALFFTTISSAQYGSLSGFENFKVIGIHSLTYGLLQAILLILGAYFWGLNGVLMALGIASAFLCILYRHSLKRILNYSFNKKIKIFTSDIRFIFVHFSIPAVLTGLLSMPVLWWGKTLLVRKAGFGEMAVFDIAEQWNFMILFIPNALSGIILPMLTNALALGIKEQYAKLIKMNLVLNGIIVSILVIFVVPLAPFIIKLYGSDFSNFLPLRIMLVITIVQTLNVVLERVIYSKGKMWLGFMINLLWAVWFILFSIIFVHKLSLGSLGLCFTLFISYFLHLLLQGTIVLRIKKTM